MCGIYGIVDLDSTVVPGRNLLERMGRVVRHRGPDDEGYYCGRGVALGMRRLSIIDLAGGHQPISNEKGTVWVVCNGEIYNFRELRATLETRGHIFQTKSDTEVISHLYEEYDLEFVRYLRGMFAIAIWDVDLSRLVLARDRVGKKPLYVRRESHRLIFGSEVKSILEAENVPRRLDMRAVDEYLALGYVPAPWTLFEGIEKVLPGHLLVVEQGQVKEHEYWDVSFREVEDRPEEEWVERVREKLLDSVRIRLISDVPLGAFLSGGIDSSSIVAAMARMTDRPVKTYSIGFAADDKYYNELPYARMVAQAFSTDHHEIIVRPEVSELLPRLLWHLDEPIGDSAFITTYLVSRLARESVTVILSGVGGDELFGGYRRYLGDGLLHYYQRLPFFLRKRIPKLFSRLPQDRHSGWKNYVRYASAFVSTAELDANTRYQSYVKVFGPEARSALLGTRGLACANGAISKSLDRYFARAHDADPLHQLMYVDIKTSLPDDLLVLTDKMTMAASVECRAPFLDQELIELTSRIPSSFKVRGLEMKHLLKKVVGPWLPKEILHRKKRGFGAPVGSWLRNDLKALVRETLSETQVQKRGLFDWRVVRNIIASHDDQQSDHTDQLLTLINLELWCRIFLDTNGWRCPPPQMHLLRDFRS
jgi:asparagine synthase (glutamine-hydrolysing)